MTTLQHIEQIAREKRVPLIYSVAFIALVGLGLWWQFAITDEIYVERLPKDASEATKLAINLLLSRSEVMASWALALIASLAFIMNLFKANEPFHPGSVAVAALTFFTCLLSVFFSHVVYDIALRTLIAEGNPLNDGRIFQMLECQYLTLIAGMILFVSFVFFLVSARRA